jgi:hypothetical protein
VDGPGVINALGLGACGDEGGVEGVGRGELTEHGRRWGRAGAGAPLGLSGGVAEGRQEQGRCRG